MSVSLSVSYQISDCTLGFFGGQFFQEVLNEDGNNLMEDIKVGGGWGESGYEL